MEEEEAYKFSAEIEDLYTLHYITTKHDHSINLRRNEWHLFEPTKFIYAYFAFNSYYNINWETSTQKKQLIMSTGSQGDKYKALIDFIFKNIKDSDKKDFFNIIKGGYKTDKLIDAISRITPDSRISGTKKNNFKTEFKKLLVDEKILVDEFKNDIIKFIYLVRNNIFHGTKTTIEMSEDFQRERLEIYTNILIATNEMLFRVLEKETMFRIRDSYKLSGFK